MSEASALAAANALGITTGSSILAIILTAPPHASQVDTSILNTRFRRCAFMPSGAGHGGMALHGRSLIAVYPAMGVLASFRRRHQRPVLAVWRKHAMESGQVSSRPCRLLGLPRAVCTAADVRKIFSHFDSPNNGLTFCAGTFGVRLDNDLPSMVTEFADRIHFAHLRGTTRSRTNPKTFHEADHLNSDIDMVAIIRSLLEEESRRRAAGREDHSIPIRPDHGHQMLDDLQKTTNPGYSVIGRLKGLAEIRGVITAIQHQL